MSALTAPRSVVTKGVDKVLFNNLDVQLKASVVVYNGALIVGTGGYGKPGVTGTGLVCLGWANLGPSLPSVTAGSTDGATTIRVQQGVARFNNSTSTDAIAQANVYGVCYVVDDNTVALTDGGGTRSVAGMIVEVDSAGVWVSIAGQLLGVGTRGAETGPQNPEELSANGAVSPTNPISRFTVSGTKAWTLADGTAGQRKRLYCVSQASTPVGVITPAHGSGFSTITFGASSAQAFVDLVFDASLGTPAWKLAGVSGTVTIA